MKIQEITTLPELIGFCAQAETSSFLSIDTEFFRLNTYRPKVCLIQIATQDTIALIDPFVTDLKPLKKLLYNKNTLKILHASRQDLEIFYHLWKEIPTPLADTQILAMVCGYGESVSYEKLVAKILQKPVNKNIPYTDWVKRPLSADQLAYAADDVRYLYDIYTHLWEKAGHKVEWIQEEMDALISPDTYTCLPENSWQKIRLHHTPSSPHFWQNLKGITTWRETVAQNMNRSRGQILKDDTIKTLAKKTSLTADDIKKELPDRLKKYAFQVLESIASYPLEIAQPIPPPKNDTILEVLKILLKQVSERNSIPSRLIASQRDLEAFLQTPTQHPLAKGWRKKIFGKDALNIITGAVAMGFKNGTPALYKISDQEIS